MPKRKATGGSVSDASAGSGPEGGPSVQRPARSMLGPASTGVPVAGGVFKSAAVEVLRMERRLMTTGDITKIALQRGFLTAQGKTPEATMASALYTDIKKKHGASLFTRPQEGLFGLREWVEEGFFPHGFWAGGGPQLEFADSGAPVAVNPTYRRGTANAQHHVTQRGPDGQLITTVSGTAAAKEGAAAVAAHEEVQPGVGGGARRLPAPVAPPAPASGRGRPRGVARQKAGGAQAAGAIHNSDEDGSDHFLAAANDTTAEDVVVVGGSSRSSGGPESGSDGGAAEGGPAASEECGAFEDPLALLGDAALADSAGAPLPPAVRAAVAPHKRPVLEVGDNDADDVADAGTTPAGVADDDAGGADVAAAAAGGTSGAGSSAEKQLAPHEIAASPMPYAARTYVDAGGGFSRQAPRKRQHLSVAIPGDGAARARTADGAGAPGGAGGGAGGGGDEEDDAERMAAQLLGGMAGMPSCDAYYRGGGTSAVEHMATLAEPLLPAPPAARAGSAGARHAQRKAASAAAAADAAAAEQAMMDWQTMQQMQYQQYMGMMSAASQAGGSRGSQWPGMFSPLGPYFDGTSLMSTPLGGWDAAAAAAASGGAGGPDLLHQMSVSLGLPPPAPLPQGAAAAAAAGRRPAPQPPAAGPITLELASPQGAAPRGASKRARGAAAGAAPAPALPSPKTAQDLSRLDEWQSTIESAEKALGRDHPAVGRAWLDLAKALQSVALHSDRARLATKRAFDVVLAATKSGPAGESFSYLLSRYTAGQGRQQQQQQQQQPCASPAGAAAAAAAAVAAASPLPSQQQTAQVAADEAAQGAAQAVQQPPAAATSGLPAAAAEAPQPMAVDVM